MMNLSKTHCIAANDLSGSRNDATISGFHATSEKAARTVLDFCEVGINSQ